MDCQVKQDKRLLAALLREASDRLEHEADDMEQPKPRLRLLRGGKLAVGVGLLGVVGARLRDHWVTATTTAAAMSMAAGMSLAVVQGPGSPPAPTQPTVAPTSYSDAQVDQSVFIPESPSPTPAQTSTPSLSSTSVSVHPSADPTGSPTGTNSAPTGRPRPSQAVSPQQSDRGRPAHPRPGDDVHDRRRSSTADGSKPGPRR